MSIDYVFAHLTARSTADELCGAAYAAGARAATADIRKIGLAAIRCTPEARDALEAWLGAYAHDEVLLAALSGTDRAHVLSSAWTSYVATVVRAQESDTGARDAAR